MHTQYSIDRGMEKFQIVADANSLEYSSIRYEAKSFHETCINILALQLVTCSSCCRPKKRAACRSSYSVHLQHLWTCIDSVRWITFLNAKWHRKFQFSVNGIYTLHVYRTVSDKGTLRLHLCGSWIFLFHKVNSMWYESRTHLNIGTRIWMAVALWIFVVQCSQFRFLLRFIPRFLKHWHLAF